MTFAHDLLQNLSSKHLLKHPFYQAWTDGTLSRETLQTYAGQYFHHVSAFPRYLSATHSGCTDVATRQMLLENLIDEERGSENHPELWLRFAESLGVTREHAQSQPLLPETRALIDTFMTAARSSYAEGLGALFAYEHQIPEIARFKLDALDKHYQIAERGQQFFKVHMQADIYHTQAISQAMDALSPAEKELAQKSADKAASALWKFLDAMGDCAGMAA